MLILKKLTFSGVGRFVDEQQIDFTQLGQMVQVDGQNLNTGDSSGAGKSTVFKALEFLLGLNQISTSVLQSRLTKDTLSVTGEFDFDGLPLKISRGKKFSINLNGEETAGSAKLTEEKLSQILGMPGDLFRKVLHKRQKEGGFFLDMSPGEVHKFLTSARGLDAERAKLETVDAKIVQLNKDITAGESRYLSGKTGLEATLGALQTLVEPKCSVDLGTVQRLSAELASAKRVHDEISQNQKADRDGLEASRPRVTTVAYDRSEIISLEPSLTAIDKSVAGIVALEKERVSALQSQIYTFRSQIQTAEQAVRQGDRATNEARVVAGQIAKLREAMCPTCEQSWATEQAKAKEADLLSKLMAYKGDMIAGKAAAASVVELSQSLEKLATEAAPRPVDTSQLDAERATIQARLATLRLEERAHQAKETQKAQIVIEEFSKKQIEQRMLHEQTIKFARDAVVKAESAYSGANYEMRAFEAALNRHMNSQSQLNLQKTIFETQVEASAKALDEAKELLEIAEDAKKAIKSYLSCSFDDSLEAIGETATRLIRSIPNMATATIQFEGLKETKEGKIKEEVNALINMDGETGISIKSLSGGERSSADLAVDLAVIQFIEEQTGKGINIMILDEPFTGLDSTCSTDAIEMLKSCNIGKTIIIVDHNPVLKEQIDSRITVVRDGTTSKILQ